MYRIFLLTAMLITSSNTAFANDSTSVNEVDVNFTAPEPDLNKVPVVGVCNNHKAAYSCHLGLQRGQYTLDGLTYKNGAYFAPVYEYSPFDGGDGRGGGVGD